MKKNDNLPQKKTRDKKITVAYEKKYQRKQKE